MKYPQQLIDFLASVRDVSIGYSELKFFATQNLDNEQVGYSVDADGNPISGNLKGYWKQHWVAIGSNELGDPIFVDCSTEPYLVLTAEHGEGEWDEIPIANSLRNFKTIVENLHTLSKDRQWPVELEKNPITKEEFKEFINCIKRNSPRSALSYWGLVVGFIEETRPQNIFSRIWKFVRSWYRW